MHVSLAIHKYHSMIHSVLGRAFFASKLSYLVGTLQLQNIFHTHIFREPILLCTIEEIPVTSVPQSDLRFVCRLNIANSSFLKTM